MPARKPPPPPGVDINLDDKDVQKAASMIQKSFRGHRVRQKLKEDGPPKYVFCRLQYHSVANRCEVGLSAYGS